MNSLIEFRRRHLLLSDTLVSCLIGVVLFVFSQKYENLSKWAGSNEVAIIITILSGLSLGSYLALLAFGGKNPHVERLKRSVVFNSILRVLLFYAVMSAALFFAQLIFSVTRPFVGAFYIVAIYRTYWVWRRTILLF